MQRLDIIMISMIIVIMLLGVLIRFKHKVNIISGYSRYDMEKKSEAEKVELAKKVGNFTIGLGVLAVFFYISIRLNMDYMILLMAGLIIAYIFGFGMVSGLGKLSRMSSAILLVIVAVFLSFILIPKSRPKPIVVGEGKVDLAGEKTVDIDEMISVMLEDKEIEIDKKQVGFDLIKVRKGNFLLENGEEVYLILQDYKSPPYIVIETEKEKIYLNYGEAKLTMEGYDKVRGLL